MERYALQNVPMESDGILSSLLHPQGKRAQRLIRLPHLREVVGKCAALSADGDVSRLLHNLCLLQTTTGPQMVCIWLT